MTELSEGVGTMVDMQRSSLASALAVVLVGTAVTACTPATAARTDVAWSSTSVPASTHVERAPSSNAPTSSVASTPAASDALAALAALPVKGRAPKTGYNRAMFGQSWSDDVTVDGGHNGCDTRNDILKRDLTDVTFKPRTRDCVILTGTLKDAYTGTTIDFVRGQNTSSKVQIDHLLSDPVSSHRHDSADQRVDDMPLSARSVQA